MLRFRTLSTSVLFPLLAAATAPAQTVAYPDEMLAISLGAAPGTLDLSWFGHTGRSYFLMYSPTLATGSWSYLPIIEPGTDATISYGATAPGEDERFFARTIIMPSASTQPKFADFDNDGVSNMDELQAGLDPLAFSDSNEDFDSDDDGLPDDWEIFYFGDLSRDGSGDYDRDGVSDAAEYAAGRRPNTGIQYGPLKFTYAGVNTAGTVVYMKDLDVDNENTLAVTYSDAAKTRVTSINLYPGISWDAVEWNNPQPLATYTEITSADGNHTLKFEPKTIVDYDGTAVTGRDLLRRIDDMPYSRQTVSGEVYRSASYLASTGIPLGVVTQKSFPAIIRDFPYGDTQFPDFGTNKQGGASNGLVDYNLGIDGLPISTLTDIDTNRRIHSAASFNLWYRKPDTLSVNMGLQPDMELEGGFSHGFKSENYFPLTTVNRDFDGFNTKLCYTAELRVKLTYDISPTSLTPTKLRYGADDDIWIFINGKLIVDRAGIQSVTGEITLRDVEHGLTAETGVCEVQVFYAERWLEDGNLSVMASTPMTPIYAYQVLVDGRFNSPVQYSLASGAPAGMTVEPTSGKLFWDYSTFSNGTYTATVNVVDTKGRSTSQALEIILGEAPAITAQPEPGYQEVTVGETVVLTVSATGTPAPTYQWYKDDEPLSGATSTTLTLASVDPADSGYYYVRVSNVISSVQSDGAYILVNEESE
jgi:fibro-slime domain-containing protein